MSKLDDILLNALWLGFDKANNTPNKHVVEEDAWKAKQQIKYLVLELIDVPPCEENCTDVRHAYHQGQWDLAQQITKKVEEL